MKRSKMQNLERNNGSVDNVDGYSGVKNSEKPFEGLSEIGSRTVGKIYTYHQVFDQLKQLQMRESERLRIYHMHENLLTSQDLLPKELWVQILGHLNQEDRESCKKASPYFENLLKTNRRTQFLFSDVIEILTRKSEMKNDPSDRRTGEQQKQQSKTWLKTLKECRLVCKSWNEGVESCFQNFRMPGTLKVGRDPTQPLIIKYIPWMAEKFHISCFAEAQTFRKHFNLQNFSGKPASKKNLFLGRFTNFIDKDPAAPNLGFYNAIQYILEYSGEAIWNCSLAVGTGHNSAEEEYLWLKSFLDLMPNLRFLHVRSFRHVIVSPEFVEQNPLPCLPKLQEIKLHHVPYDIANEILRQNPHILRLNADRIAEVDHNVFNSLTVLQALKSKHSALGYRFVTELRIFPRLSSLSIETNVDLFTGPQLFRILENNNLETLTDLKISNPLLAEWDSEAEREFSKNGRLILPCLRSLELSMWDYHAFFLDFILPTKGTLQHLQVNAHLPGEIALPAAPDKLSERVKHEQKIEFEGYQENLLDSNIWQVFPKLSVIMLKGANKKFLYKKNIQHT